MFVAGFERFGIWRGPNAAQAGSILDRITETPLFAIYIGGFVGPDLLTGTPTAAEATIKR
jgi:hypothetical protein